MYASSISWGRCFTPVHRAAQSFGSTWESFCLPADRPARIASPGATAWKVSGSEWNMITLHCFHSNYQPREMPQQLSSATFSHAVQKEEVFMWWSSWDLFVFVRPAIHRGDPGERGRDSPSAIKTHTQKKGRISAHLSKPYRTWKRRNNTSSSQKDEVSALPARKTAKNILLSFNTMPEETVY